MWKRLVFAGRLISALWAGLVAVASVLAVNSYIDISPGTQTFAWITSTCMLGLGSVAGIAASRIRDTRGERAKLFDDAMMGMLINLSMGGTLRFEDLAVTRV